MRVALNAGYKRSKNTSLKLSPTISANPLDEMQEEQYNKMKRASQNPPKSSHMSGLTLKKSLFVRDQYDVDGESEANLETSKIRCMNTEKINRVSERFKKLN